MTDDKGEIDFENVVCGGGSFREGFRRRVEAGGTDFVVVQVGEKASAGVRQVDEVREAAIGSRIGVLANKRPP